MTPQEFWRAMYPAKFEADPLFEEATRNLTWDSIIQSLKKSRQDDLKILQIQERELSILKRLRDGDYDPHIGQLTFCCPVCGSTYMHIQSVATLKCGDESGDEPIPGTDTLYEGVGWRRPAVAILIDGESCGHQFRLRVQQHKGEIFIFTETMEWQEIERSARSTPITAEALAILESVDDF
jgi:hypothetical protein